MSSLPVALRPRLKGVGEECSQNWSSWNKEWRLLRGYAAVKHQRPPPNAPQGNASDLTIELRNPFSEPPAARWLSFSLYLAAYASALVCNSLLCLAICAHRRLHRPMYLLVCAMSGVDLVAATNSLPALARSTFGAVAIPLGECVAQMFVAHATLRMQTSTLCLMSLDRYVAIGHPLRYGALVTNARAAASLASAAALVVLLCLANVVGVLRLDFCRPVAIPVPVCNYLGLVHVACGDVAGHVAYGYATLAIYVAAPAAIVSVAYARVLLEFRRPGLRATQRRAVHACVTQLMVAGVYFVSILVSFVNSFPFPESRAAEARFSFHVLHYMLPCTLNPVIYGLRMSEIRRVAFQRFRGKVVQQQWQQQQEQLE
ncbi:olfactory receptor 51E1-like [Lethenteron reissneri]|uniref:olfactory receptor 51E1-like n=1 Tax=Lethenteron reissneri TaxID=7753 RepID=UPI002AB7AE45|nr:olfactory receptor 51E1-like [Lethenteron reissneri]